MTDREGNYRRSISCEVELPAWSEGGGPAVALSDFSEAGSCEALDSRMDRMVGYQGIRILKWDNISGQRGQGGVYLRVGEEFTKSRKSFTLATAAETFLGDAILLEFAVEYDRRNTRDIWAMLIKRMRLLTRPGISVLLLR